MSTRSLTIVKGRLGENMVMYRQMDGYPEGHGLELFDKFGEYKIVNGISINSDHRKEANGLDCFAAQIVAYFKEGIGGIYLFPSGTRDVDEEWVYTFYLSDGELYMSLLDVYGKKIVFDDKFSNYKEWFNGEWLAKQKLDK